MWIIPEYVGAKRKIGFWWSLVACVFLTPFVGGIITALSPKLEEYKTENIKKLKERKRVRTEQDKKLDNLKSLKDDGILTEPEYQDKVETLKKEKAELEEKRLLDELKKQDSYKKLKSLFDNGVLTKEEFDSKIEIIKNNFKKTEIGKQKNKTLSKKTLVGKWEEHNTNLYFFNNNSVFFTYKKNTMKPKKGFYEIYENKIKIRFDKHNLILNVKKLDNFQLEYMIGKASRVFNKSKDNHEEFDYESCLHDYNKRRRKVNTIFIVGYSVVILIVILYETLTK